MTSTRWAGAEAYERYMGRWSRELAREYLEWLDPGPGLRWLDVGCGTGALTSQVVGLTPSEVYGIDASDAFVEQARASVRDPRVRFETGDAQRLPFDDGTFDVVVSGLLLNFVPEPAAAVREMTRVSAPAGVVASYVWDYSHGMLPLRHFWDAVLAQVPAAREVEEVRRFALCKPEPLRTLFEDAGLADVEVVAIEIRTHFRDFDDYWSPFLAGRGAAPAFLVSLPDADRLAVEESLRSKLPREADGSIELAARAWAVRGRVPR
jgi:SAM-dependent methyltransferase